MRKKANTETAKLIQKLTKLSHDYIRRRDSKTENKADGLIGGYCFDCGNPADGQNFQCGHFVPDSVGGALLRYHPHNMHGQRSGCNMAYQQEKVKIDYTLAMIKKYGKARVVKILQLKHKTVKADVLFYQKLIDLYEEGNEGKIVKYLENV